MILPYIDAMNIDLKSMDENFYRDICQGSLSPVLETIKTAAKSCHIELTNLVVPTLNDSDEHFRNLVNWIYDNLDRGLGILSERTFDPPGGLHFKSKGSLMRTKYRKEVQETL